MNELLERVMPEYDYRERHRKWVPAGKVETFETLLGLRMGELRVTGLLLRARGGPSAWRRGVGEVGDLLVLNSMGPRRLIEDPPREILLADVARYTRARPVRPERAPRDDAEFRAFSEPGWTKVVMNFELRSQDSGTLVSTETRVHATDQATRRKFALYWLMIRAGSGLIRRDMLAALSRRVRTRGDRT
ncbi:hypothetical protein CDG81_18235 [Actinopolyspora erythraea]|uniref:DUF2867 domain-containing protein n=1 Tax=Actinopolyspora erythraea TaxID=414996 RepID=A0A099D2Y3_9ACTN|nr:hypothetical protein [Actinopolyspora erythraea]ASU79879.1 hypothetical protein CDG81_18235 [Actinopolyspora erythraea]KGI79690.1 hypothetical protein IL38_21810 [Actinopolyspora erythraea]